MKKLIKITNGENGSKLVSARELHEFLEVTERFQQWLDKRIEKYEFVENEDFTSVKSFTVVNNGARKEIQDYVITTDMAKELSMIQNTARGKEARKYFIQCEKQVQENISKLPTTFKEALLMLVEAEEEKEKLQLANKELSEEVTYKEDIIIGLVKEISVVEKRQRITQIVRYKTSDFSAKYKLLYSEFDKTYHINSQLRMTNAKENGTCKKAVNRMGYICDVMNMTNELYDIACKLFCNDVSELMTEMWDVIGNKQQIGGGKN